MIRQRKAGMSILEVMVALGLTAILVMVVMKLNEKQIAANKDFILRNEVEMIRLEVIGLLQKDCRGILQDLQIGPTDTKDTIEKKNLSNLPLKYYSGDPTEITKPFDPMKYQLVPRYQNYTSHGAALSDTAGSLWLQDVRLAFDGDKFALITESNNKLEAAIFLDFYRRLGSNHESPKGDESNLTNIIPLTIVFKKKDDGSDLEKEDGHYVISRCSCLGEAGLSMQEVAEYICEKFLGGTPGAGSSGSADTYCTQWNVDTGVSFNGEMKAKHANIESMEAHDTLCAEAGVTGNVCTRMHNIYDALTKSDQIGGTTAKMIVKKLKDNLTTADPKLAQGLQDCLQSTGTCGGGAGIDWNGKNFKTRDELIEYLKTN